MAEEMTILKGMLQDHTGKELLPKTQASQVETEDGSTVEAKLAAADVHMASRDIHVTAGDKAAWNGKETPEGAQQKVDSSIAAHNGEGEAHPAIQVLLADLESRLGTLELKYGTNVTGNPFSVGFEALTGLEVAGVWNQPYARVEF